MIETHSPTTKTYVWYHQKFLIRIECGVTEQQNPEFASSVQTRSLGSKLTRMISITIVV